MINKILGGTTFTVIAVLIILLVIKTKQLNVIQEKNLMSASSIARLEKELGFNKNTIAALQLENGRLVILTKDKNGNVVPQSPYVPPEGGAKIVVDVDPSSTTGTPSVRITVKNKGFTLKPGIGIVWSASLYPELDCKIAYWDRYSVKVGATTKFVDLAITRHVDDLIPFIDVRNLEVQAGAGINYVDMAKRFILGTRTNF